MAMKVDWVKRKDELDREAKWLGEGETIEVVYGEFEEVKTPRSDEETGRKYETTDFKIGCMVRGKKCYRLVNKYLFSEIVGMFQEAKKTKDGETLTFMRPYGNGGSRRRQR
jgi:hypothetical protein